MTVRLVALVALLLGLLAGCATDSPAAGRAPSGAPAPILSATPQPAATLTVTRLGLDAAPLAPLGLNPDRTVVVPPVERPEQVGVYALGPRPGETGPAVILGHVNGGGRPGAFARLDTLAVGDPVTTSIGASPTTFRVTAVERVPKDRFPTSRVYGDTAGPELRLITCGGAFDGETYRDNVIVYARKG